MKITTINKQNKSAFETLISREYYQSMTIPGRFALGALGEDEQGLYAAGVLIFDVMPGLNDDGEAIAAIVKWIYVAREHRRKGTANALIQNMLHILAGTGTQAVLADVPFGNEYNLTCAVFESWGFQIGLINKYEFFCPLEELLSHKLFKRTPTRKVYSMEVLGKEEILRIIDKFQRLNYMLSDIARYIEQLDLKLSCFIHENNKISSILLVRCVPGAELLQLLCVRTVSGKGDHIMDLLLYAGNRARENYSMKTTVHLICNSREGAKIISAMYPKEESILVRRCLRGVDREAEQEIDAT